MPAQSFSLNEHSAPLARLEWDFGPVTIDLSYNATLLTRITDPDSLRVTGMQGQAPDGSTLVLRLITGSNGDQFTLERDGATMYAQPVDFAASRSSAAPPVAAMPSASAAAEKAMTSGRRWLTGLGIFAMLGGVLFFALAGSSTNDLGLDRQIDPKGLRVAGVVAFVLGALYLVLARMAKGPRAKTMFGVASAITGLNLLATIANVVRSGGAGVVGVGLAAFSFSRIFKAYKAAKSVP